MAEKLQENKGEATKNKSGAGKFFLGAALGAAAGFIASKFVSAKMPKIEDDDDDDDDDDELVIEAGIGCKCGKDCKCGKGEKCDCKKGDTKAAEAKVTKTESKSEEKPSEKKEAVTGKKEVVAEKKETTTEKKEVATEKKTSSKM